MPHTRVLRVIKPQGCFPELALPFNSGLEEKILVAYKEMHRQVGCIAGKLHGSLWRCRTDGSYCRPYVRPG